MNIEREMQEQLMIDCRYMIDVLRYQSESDRAFHKAIRNLADTLKSIGENI